MGRPRVTNWADLAQ